MERPKIVYVESSFPRWEGDGDKNMYNADEADKYMDWQAHILTRRDRQVAKLKKELKKLRGKMYQASIILEEQTLG